ncbi:MAG: M48 family metallopeptidase [Planctomycetes bacterium]|nr:M48 family metallopeptidase [Planctomycetota bacterium]
MQGSKDVRKQRKSSGFYRAGAALALVCLGACFTTPVTGRKSFNLTPVSSDKTIGADTYQEMLKTVKLADSDPKYAAEFAMVKRCVDRLVAVADDPGGFEWEVHLIDDPKTVNAWCLPGGKMAVYTGILPVTKDETGLAVVMGHEIGHAVARHGTERMSSEGFLDVGLQLIGLKYQSVQQYTEYIGAAKTLLISLPWGREQELEADEIGLMYMARAGYDPDQAVEFWKRMAEQSGGSPPEFLSTHPSDETRIAGLKDNLKKARAIYAGKKSWKPGGENSK